MGRRALDGVRAFYDVEIGEGGGRGEGMGRVRVAVPEHCVAGAALLDHLPDLLRSQAGGEWNVPRGDPLGQRYQIGLDAVRLGPEPMTEAPETADDLVGDHEHVVVTQHLTDGSEVVLRRDDSASQSRWGALT